jgi:hypothetical protein
MCIFIDELVICPAYVWVSSTMMERGVGEWCWMMVRMAIWPPGEAGGDIHVV